MKFNLNTNNSESISLKIEDVEKNNMVVALEELIFGMTLFFVEFIKQRKCSSLESAKELLSICMPILEDKIIIMLENELFNKKEISEVERIVKELENAGFSYEEICDTIKLIEDTGSVEGAAHVLLKEIAESLNINLDEEDGNEDYGL